MQQNTPRKKHWPKLLLIAIVVYIIALIACFPARIAWQWFAAEEAEANNVSLTSINGTIWHGSANELTINGITLRQLTWDWRASDLLGFGLGADITLNAGAGPVQASVTAYGEQDITAQNLIGELPLSLLLKGTPYAVYLKDGIVNLDIDRLEIREGLPYTADGFVRASNLSIGLMVPSAPIGDYQIVLTPSKIENGAITLAVSDDSLNTPPLKTAITIELDEDGCYQPAGYLEPTEQLDGRLQRMLGQLDNQGRIPVDQAGCLPNNRSTSE